MKRLLVTAAALVGALALGACSDSLSSNGFGTMSVKLTDAPFALSEVQSADMFVVRVDAKMAAATDAEAADQADPADNTDPSAGWVTIAEPKQSFNLMDLQNGVSVDLGQLALPTGQYRGFRVILDTDKSSITLTDGTVLTGNATPGIVWPSAGETGIKVNLTQPVTLTADGTQVMVDFDLANSFVLRGSSIESEGLLFTPVIRATAGGM